MSLNNSIKISPEAEINFKLFKIKDEFFEITDWKPYQIRMSPKRPSAVLAIEVESYPNTYCCIPLSKDNDKDKKYHNLSINKPDLVHAVQTLPEYESYLLIQNMFYLRKEFLGAPYIGKDGEQLIIEVEQEEILKKVRKIDALLNRGKINYVPRETVFNIQRTYLNDKKK